MSILDIVDLSNNNGSKNIKDYPADGYMFKATEGNYFTDRYCDQFVQQAIKAGKVWGVYHFMDGSPWQAQADYFIAATKGYVGKGILCLDYEMYGRQGPAIAKKWLDYVYQKTGVRPIIYMSASVTKEENWTEVVKANYGLWVADYSAPLDKLGYWPGAMMWQYTSTPYDKNYFYGDRTAWLKYAAKAGNQPAPEKPSTPSTGSKLPSLESLATDAAKGKYGNGDARKKALGTLYTGVQAIINHRTNPSGLTTKTVDILVKETLKGVYGNGVDRVARLGSYYKAVQDKINKR